MNHAAENGQPCVYRCFSAAGELLYADWSSRCAQRLDGHVAEAWFTEVRGITLEWCSGESAAAATVRRIAMVENPRYSGSRHPGTRAQGRQDPSPALVKNLLPAARRISDAWREIHGEEISGNVLSRRMRIHKVTANALLREIRSAGKPVLTDQRHDGRGEAELLGEARSAYVWLMREHGRARQADVALMIRKAKAWVNEHWPEIQTATGERFQDLVDRGTQAEKDRGWALTTRELQVALGVSNTLTCKVWRVLRGMDTIDGAQATGR